MSPVGNQHAAPPLNDVDLRVEVLPAVGAVGREEVVDRTKTPPIFVIGDRSGHLGALLDTHREISFIPGPGLLSGLVRAVSDNRGALSHYGYPDQYWLQSVARYYDGLQRDHAASRGRRRWAGVAPGDDIDFVDRLYPRCQIVQVTGVSQRRSRRKGRSPMLPGRYCEVRSADLRTDPKGTLRTILDFLGEAWDPAVFGSSVP